jgi:cytochrome d ubiquinol oxidase subunit I
MLVGHSQAQYMIKIQPMKMAAAEALWESEDPAAMSLFTIGSEPELKDVFAIKVPGLLSFLAYNRFTGEVKGIKALQTQFEQQFGPGDYIPPVAVSYWTFRIMIGAGIVMALLAFYGLYLLLRNKFEQSRRYLWLLIPAVALPYLANSAGWLFTELARQPWIVYGLQKTAEAVSPNVGVGSVLFSLISFTLIYGVLMAANIYLLVKFAKIGPGQPAAAVEPAKGPAGAPVGAYLK